MPDSDFDRFWSAYPRKVGKLAARAEWERLRPNLADVMEALAWQSQEPQWREDDGKYIPHPRTWLHQGRWMDEPIQTKQKERAPTFSEMKAKRWAS